nr:MAG TPA: hypothetical protein [Inoviridae sp.]
MLDYSFTNIVWNIIRRKPLRADACTPHADLWSLVITLQFVSKPL